MSARRAGPVGWLVVAYFGALAVLLSVVPVYLAQRLAGSDSVRGSTVAR